MKKFVILIFLILYVYTGCELNSQKEQPSAQKEVSKSGEEVQKKLKQQDEKLVQSKNAQAPVAVPSDFKPFYIFSDKGSRQNHYVPSGFMPNGNCITFSDVWQENCQSGKSCVKVVYDVECSRKDQKWAGVYWLNPANNWGSRKGGFNLTGAKQLTFWAKGEKGGEQIQEFTFGGISGNYPDTDTAVIGPVILGSKWRQYSIDLRGKDLTYISGGFAWTTSEDVNPEDCTFYLDEIRFE